MKNILNNKYFTFIVRLATGIFFVYAAQSKLMHTYEFGEAIRAYQIIPDYLSAIPAIFIPWIELYCGIFLIAGFYTRSSASVSAVLLIILTINILIALLRGLDIDCGCGISLFGIDHISWLKILENIVIIVILMYISRKDSFFLALDNRRKNT